MLNLAKLVSPAVRRLARAHAEERERADRLEIAVRRLAMRQDAAAADLEKLSERIAAIGGRLGGRPRAAPQGAPEQLSIDQVPVGDKAALRRAMGVHLVKPSTRNQE
jgi:hypothetical protein